MESKPKLYKPNNRQSINTISKQKTEKPIIVSNQDKSNQEKKIENNQHSQCKYTDMDIHNYTVADGYILVHPALWDYIPNDSHIRYIKKDDGNDLARNERFKPGGFVKNHYVNKDGKKMIILETVLGGNKNQNIGDYISFPIAYNDIDELWKKYDRYAFVEIHMIYNSLAVKKHQIELLEAKNKDLEKRLLTIENILRNAIKK